MGLFVALSASSQTTVNPSNSNTCFGQSVTLVASVMGYDADTLNFNWYLGTTLQGSINDTINITPSTVGSNTVTVQVTDSVGSGTQPIGTIAFATIFVNSNPIATASNGGPYCQSNGPIQLQASGGINYSWAGPNGFSSNA
ncbi:PKD domain-containing protein, partial [Patescibacteria group bacterium]|nr:PKD domain-containing protein [Patescibacteria group bacterium]